VQEGGPALLEAIRNRDLRHLEKVRTRLGKWWVTAGDESEEELNLGMGEDGEGKEWGFWEDVVLAWASVGSVAASMRMVWTTRNRMWRKSKWRWPSLFSGAANGRSMGRARRW
jgi:hypothetical protein